MRVQGVGAWQTSTIALPDGIPGTARTIQLIRQLVEEGVKHPRIRRTATDILRGVPAYNDPAEVSAIYNWVLRNIRFTKDMLGVGHGIETLQPAVAILETRAGDCDDFVILLASLLGSVGYETQAVTVAASAADPENFSHIYLEAKVKGQWIALDAARPDAQFGRAPETYWMIRRWPLTHAGDRETLGGLGMATRPTFPRFGLRGLGQDGFDWGQLVDVIPDITKGTAQIITAARMPTAYAYQQMYPGTAYGMPPGITVSGQANTQVWMILGVGLLALFFLSRK